MIRAAYSDALTGPSLISCAHCDVLQRLPELGVGGSARCPRCNKEPGGGVPDSLNRTFALTLAAAVLYVIANSVPMLGLTIVGRADSTTVLGGVETLWQDGQELVLRAGAIDGHGRASTLQICIMLAIAIGARGERSPRWVGTLLRHHPTTRTWSMIEVMMLGVLVALVKIADYATVIPGVALFVLGALVFVLTRRCRRLRPARGLGEDRGGRTTRPHAYGR